MMDREIVIKGCENWVNNHKGEDLLITYSSVVELLELLKEQDAIVHCKDCKHRPKEPNSKTYESGFDIEFPEGSKCPCQCSGDEYYSWYPEDNWFCADGERRNE